MLLAYLEPLIQSLSCPEEGLYTDLTCQENAGRSVLSVPPVSRARGPRGTQRGFERAGPPATDKFTSCEVYAKGVLGEGGGRARTSVRRALCKTAGEDHPTT